MKEILDRLESWIAEGKEVATATVIAVERSAPRDPGAVLAVTTDMEVAGSVSGGCVEGAVIDEALEVIRTGRPRRLTYGIADEDAFAVGLSCGGTVHIFVEPPGWLKSGIFTALARAIRAERPAALATETAGPNPGAQLLVSPDASLGTLGSPELDAAVTADAREALAEGDTAAARRYEALPGGEPVEIFIDPFVPPPLMYVFGATDHATAVVRIGKFLGYRVVLCDARAALATRERFPDADQLEVRWPDEFLATAPVDRRTVMCILTHDPKFEIPLLKVALGTPARYIGALGSRRTHEARTRKLADAGFLPEEVARVRAPIGLDIGACTPAEVAVAIAAEIIALRNGRPGGFLARVPGASRTEERARPRIAEPGR
jgi:xanthine dehydrogenase accessory factor